MKHNTIVFAIVITGVLGAVLLYTTRSSEKTEHMPMEGLDATMAAQFDYLRNNGNSSCSQNFIKNIDMMKDGERLRGSCCSAMDMHRYAEQVTGLKTYVDIPEIPPDPYDIDATLAKKLKGNYDITLTLEQQKAYDYAMANSHEKGPCCCKCWRWYVYGGLGKLLITKYHFSGEQVTEVWNLSDGCGGAEHAE